MTWDYLNLRHTDTSPNVKGYPNISYDMGLLGIRTNIAVQVSKDI